MAQKWYEDWWHFRGLVLNVAEEYCPITLGALRVALSWGRDDVSRGESQSVPSLDNSFALLLAVGGRVAVRKIAYRVHIQFVCLRGK